MKIKKAKELTMKVIKWDMFLNWLLGFVFLIFPKFIEDLLVTGDAEILSLFFWFAIGAGFLLFAAWQLDLIKRDRLGSGDLVFAAIMAFGPVVGLTVVLFMNFPLKDWARILLWIGNIYMFFLGAWYLFLSFKIKK